MKGTEKTPALRFHDFDGDWTASKVADVTTYVDYRGKTPPKSESGVFLVTAKNVKVGHIDYECSKEYIPQELYDEVMRRGRPRLGDVLITTEAPLGNVATIDRIDVALAQRIIKLRGKENVLSNDFLKHILLSQSFQKLLNEKSTGSTAKGIRGSVLHKLPLLFPSMAEQQKIAAFLSAVDEKIGKLARKRDLLLKYKKGVMQQVFDQKIRFKDDDGNDFPDWEEKKLGEATTYIGSGLSLDQESEETGVRVTRIETISDGRINLDKVGFIKTEEDISRYRLQVGDILFSNINSVSHIGKMAYVNQEYDLYHGMNLLNIRFDRKSHNSQFFYFLMETFRYKKHFQQICNRAVSQASINQTDLKKTKLLVPCLEEQSRIASFISKLDEKINLINQQLEKAKTFKAGLLEQMFI